MLQHLTEQVLRGFIFSAAVMGVSRKTEESELLHVQSDREESPQKEHDIKINSGQGLAEPHS